MLLFGEQSIVGKTDQEDLLVDHQYGLQRDFHGLDHKSRVGDGENRSDSRHPSMVEPTGFADGLDKGESKEIRRENITVGLLA